MVGSKVVFTYKRKRSSLRSSFAREDGYPNSISNHISSNISTTPENHEESTKDHKCNESEVRRHLIKSYKYTDIIRYGLCSLAILIRIARNNI